MSSGLFFDIIVRLRGVERQRVDEVRSALQSALEVPLRVGVNHLTGVIRRVRFSLDRLDEAVLLIQVQSQSPVNSDVIQHSIKELNWRFAAYVDQPLLPGITYTVVSFTPNAQAASDLVEED
jgi:hypothetical protein